MIPGTVNGVEGDNGHPRKLISFLFVFGITLLCAGFLLSMFVLQTCPSGGFGDCKGALKIIGPLLAVVGLVCIILAQSRAKGYLQEVQLHNDQVYGFVFCRGNCQFAQFLVFGFLFLTSGMLISVLGIWIPGCSPGWRYQQQFNHSNTSSVELQDCGFHSVQTMGPLIVLIGLCFFVIAHIKKKQNVNLVQESSAHEEEQLNPDSFHVTVGRIDLSLSQCECYTLTLIKDETKLSPSRENLKEAVAPSTLHGYAVSGCFECLGGKMMATASLWHVPLEEHQESRGDQHRGFSMHKSIAKGVV
uniref:Transmembrane protein 171 n=1 Tax=Anolis carolinensis TaxID=28377 RepID=G1KJ11_ANOCA